MPSLSEILKDPNYTSANAETKQAIFERWAPQDPNYANANEETKSAIKQRFGLATAAEIPTSGVPGPRRTQTASTVDVLTSAPYRAVAGAADIFLTAPQNIANLAKMGYGTAVTAMGRPELAPEVTAPQQPVAEIFKRAGLIREPQGEMTSGQRVADVALQGATSALLGGAPAVVRTATTLPQAGRAAAGVATMGAGAGGAGQIVTEATGEPLLGAATSMALPGVAISRAQARQAQLQAEQQRNAVRDLTVRAAQQEGYLVTPGSVTPSSQNVIAERLGGKTRVQQEFAARNQEVTDRLARRALGLPENAPLERATTQQIRKEEFKKGYEPLNRIGPVRTDQDFSDALDNVLQAYTGPGRSFPGAIPQPVVDLVGSYRVGQFNSADAIQATRTLREQASTNISRGDKSLGLAQRAISNALEDQIERSLQQAGNPNAQAMLDQFRASRQRMAISHSVEDAIIEGGGSVNARQLANDLQTRGKYFSGDLDLIARFANIARPVATQPGTQGTPGAGTLLGGAGAGIGGYGGYAIGGGPGAAVGGMIGAMFPQAVSAAARRYMRSDLAQQRAIPTYERPGVNALAASNEAVMRAMMGIPTFTNQPTNALVQP